MTPISGGGWIVAVEVPHAAVTVFARALEQFGCAVSMFETGTDEIWRVEVYAEAPPPAAALAAAVALAACVAGIPEPEPHCAPLPETDWLAENRKSFAPLRVGRYFVHGTDWQGVRPAATIPLVLDAGLAFGTGTHGSTRGCLLALDWLARRGQVRPRRALDLGCGSGILSLAVARTWRSAVVAVDIDPVAVTVARANLRRNGVAARVRVCCADGLRHPLVRRTAPYDLIVANLLARPLERLAPMLVRHLARRGILILSGLLAHQEKGVRAAYRRQNIRILREEKPDGWHTLVLAR